MEMKFQSLSVSNYGTLYISAFFQPHRQRQSHLTADANIRLHMKLIWCQTFPSLLRITLFFLFLYLASGLKIWGRYDVRCCLYSIQDNTSYSPPSGGKRNIVNITEHHLTVFVIILTNQTLGLSPGMCRFYVFQTQEILPI